MKKTFPFSLGLVLLWVSLTAWGIPQAQACHNGVERFWTAMTGVDLTINQYMALGNYVNASPIKSQEQLCDDLIIKWGDIKAGLINNTLANDLIDEYMDLLNKFIAGRTHFLAFLTSVLTPEQLDIFRGNVLDMALERGNMRLQILKAVHSAGLPLEIKSQLGDDWLLFLKNVVVPLQAEMAVNRIDLRLTIRQYPTDRKTIDERLVTLALLRTQLIESQIWFLLHMRNLVGADKMADILENWELIVHPDED